MPLLWLGGSALALGVLHGLGADHLMAIAAMTVDANPARDRRSRIIRTAFQFACGHTLVLGTGLIVAVVFGWMIPEASIAVAERVGGGLLVVLGGAGLWSVFAGRTYGHVHPESDGRSRWHLHFGTAHPAGVHPHSRLPALMGAVFAFSSLRVLVTLTPLGTSVEALAMPGVLLLLALFGLGILLSMSLFGVLLARVWSLRAVNGLGRTAGVLVSAASALLGLYWMVAG